MKQKVWGCSWGCPRCEWSPTLVPQYFGSPCLVSQTAACRDAGGTGSPCLPRQGQLAKISFLHPGLLFTHCSILLMRAGSAQVEGGHPGAKAVPRPVQISYHRWLSFPEPDFTSVLQITLGTALHWCWVTKIPVVSWKRVRSSLPCYLVSPDEQQWSASGELINDSLIPTVSFPGAPQVLSGLLAGPGPLVILTKPFWATSLSLGGAALREQLGFCPGLAALISFWSILILSVNELQVACTYLQDSCSQGKLQAFNTTAVKTGGRTEVWCCALAVGRAGHWLHVWYRMSLLKKHMENGLPLCHHFSGVLLLVVSQARLYQPGAISVASGQWWAVRSVKCWGDSEVLPALQTSGQDPVSHLTYCRPWVRWSCGGFLLWQCLL